MEETVEAKNINDYLKTLVRVPNTNEPMFRLIWSENATELRLGTFPIFYKGVKIGETKKIERVLKYSWVKERWVLEQWYPPEVVLNPELPNSVEGSYEPLYIFTTKNCEVLPLNLNVVKLIVGHILHGPKRSMMQRRTDDATDEATRDEQTQKYFEDVIDPSPICSLLHSKEAISVPPNFEDK